MQPLGETSTPQVFSTPCKINTTKEKDYAWAIHHYCYWPERRNLPEQGSHQFTKGDRVVNIYIKGSIKKLPLGFALLERVDSLQLKMVSDIFPRFFSIYLALKSQDWLWAVYLSLAISMIRNLLISADLPCSLF
jgi:hypothetical protein